MPRKQWAEPIKGGEFEGRGNHAASQPGGPLPLEAGAGIDVKFRSSNVRSFGRLWRRRGAPEAALKLFERAQSRYKGHSECLPGASVRKKSILGSSCGFLDRQNHSFTTVKHSFFDMPSDASVATFGLLLVFLSGVWTPPWHFDRIPLVC